MIAATNKTRRMPNVISISPSPHLVIFMAAHRAGGIDQDGAQQAEDDECCQAVVPHGYGSSPASARRATLTTKRTPSASPPKLSSIPSNPKRSNSPSTPMKY